MTLSETMPYPSVTVVIPNYNGKEHLRDCFTSLAKLKYPRDRVEVILVDNASSDGSVEFTGSSFPWVKVVQNGQNLGFAAGCNVGARQAGGKYVAFLNNDMRVDPNWLAELVRSLSKDPQVVCSASKILNWKGKLIDFAGGSLNFYGHAFQTGSGEEDKGQFDEEKAVLFACGGAMLIDRDVFLECGAFDEDYFMFFEDVDLGWRLWVLGYQVIFAPKSIVYHKGHASASRVPDHEKRVLYERNALFSTIKNYDDKNLQRLLPAALLLTAKKALVYGRVDRQKYQFGTSGAGSNPVEQVPSLGVSHLVALDEVIDQMPALLKKRDQVQARRQRSDEEILPLFQEPLTPNCLDSDFLRAQVELEESLHIRDIFPGNDKRHILIVSNDFVDVNMAGPGIRSWEFAKALSKKHKVTLAVPNKTSLSGEGFQLKTYQPGGRTLRTLAQNHDILITQGFVLHHFPFLKDMARYVVVDIYDPFTLENLQVHAGRSTRERLEFHQSDLAVLNSQLTIGDFFICASENQRDYWLGMLAANNRINPHSHDDDPTLRRLIDVVPFGLPEEPPKHTKNVLKGVFEGIGHDDKVIFWGGGIWEWFDPLTLIQAVARVVEKRPEVKLFFAGTRHPNTRDVPEMKMCSRAIALSNELGLYNKHVFFNSWVPYGERHNYLLEADIGASFHLDHAETRFSFRTRLLDYIWAGLPMVITKGDTVSELVERYSLGRTIAPEDVDGLTRALLELLEIPNLRETYRRNFEELSSQLTWEKAIGPLADFCANPYRAADKGRASYPAPEASTATVVPTPLQALPGKAWRTLQSQGPRRLLFEARSYWRWRMGMLRKGY